MNINLISPCSRLLNFLFECPGIRLQNRIRIELDRYRFFFPSSYFCYYDLVIFCILSFCGFPASLTLSYIVSIEDGNISLFALVDVPIVVCGLQVLMVDVSFSWKLWPSMITSHDPKTSRSLFCSSLSILRTMQLTNF